MAKAKKTTSEVKSLTSLDSKELMTELTTARKAFFTLRMKHSLGELKQPHLVRKARKNIAQISTALNTVSL